MPRAVVVHKALLDASYYQYCKGAKPTPFNDDPMDDVRRRLPQYTFRDVQAGLFRLDPCDKVIDAVGDEIRIFLTAILHIAKIANLDHTSESTL